MFWSTLIYMRGGVIQVLNFLENRLIQGLEGVC